MTDGHGDSHPVVATLERYAPLFVWVLVIVSLLLIPLNIVGQGFLPQDDALRHAAYVVSGQEWSDIFVMREGITLDHNGGWHKVLGLVHGLTEWDADALVAFSVVAIALFFLLAPLPFLSRPEAWVAALLAATVAKPHLMYRAALGRPYILVMAALIVILLIWTRRSENQRASAALLVVTALLMSAGIFVHGGWYLFCLLPAAFFFAQRWRQGFLMMGCWAVGSIVAACMTGRPFHFLDQQVQVVLSCFGYDIPQRLLVTEFQPFDGVFSFVVLAAFVFVGRAVRGRSVSSIYRNPAFMLAVLCWVLSFSVRRFWLDWGLPAFLIWLALEIQDVLEDHLPRASYQRIVMSLIVAGGFYLASVSDLDSRWTQNLTTEYLEEGSEELEGWLPDPGGIMYNDHTKVFYQTFFKNPNASWKYILGFEVTFMPKEDFDILQRIKWNYNTPEAYEPWVAKLRPSDRLVLHRPGVAPPAIDGLEWYYGATDTWIGRLPR